MQEALILCLLIFTRQKQGISRLLKMCIRDRVYIDRTGQSMIGVRFDATLQKITNPAQLVIQSVYEVEHWIGYVFDSIHLMFVGKVTADDISGPVAVSYTHLDVYKRQG